MRFLSVAALFAVALVARPFAEAKVEKLTLTSPAGNHTYCLFVPDRPAGTKMPLLLLLHGSGRNGKS
jgi:poly(3-hydroxybutyrate) depolymerase